MNPVGEGVRKEDHFHKYGTHRGRVLHKDLFLEGKGLDSHPRNRTYLLVKRGRQGVDGVGVTDKRKKREPIAIIQFDGYRH